MDAIFIYTTMLTMSSIRIVLNKIEKKKNIWFWFRTLSSLDLSSTPTSLSLALALNASLQWIFSMFTQNKLGNTWLSNATKLWMNKWKNKKKHKIKTNVIRKYVTPTNRGGFCSGFSITLQVSVFFFFFSFILSHKNNNIYVHIIPKINVTNKNIWYLTPLQCQQDK